MRLPVNGLSRLIAVAALFGQAMAGGAVSFSGVELPRAVVGRGYSYALHALGDGRCASGDVGFSLAAGELPPGVELTGVGLSGIPQAIGAYRFAIRAADGCSARSGEFTLLVTGRPVLRTAPAELAFEYRAGDRAPEPQAIVVSSTWPGLAYAAVADQAWVTLRQREGVTPLPGSAFSGDAVTISVAPEALAPGVHRAQVVVSTWQGANAPAIPVKVTILPAAVSKP